MSLLMSQLLERDPELKREGGNNQDKPPIAHLAPVMADGKRRSFCGADLLGIPAANLPHTLCEECQRLAQSHPRYRR
jgi:hypothetical protein